VQGSSKTPDVIDKAALNLLIKIKEKLESMSNTDFIALKSRVFEFLFVDSFKLSNLGNTYFSKIVDETYDFINYKRIQLYLDSIKLVDIINMFNEKFLLNDNIKITVYVRIILLNNLTY